MEQRITDKLTINTGYRINRQLLVCLNDIFTKYDSEVQTTITASCKKIKYTFSSIDEFLEESKTLSDKIEVLAIKARFPIAKGYSCNEISANFNNEATIIAGGEISFDFTDPNGYLILKNQIETLLKNYKLSYSIPARIALTPLIGTTVFFAICAYTYIQKIIYPKPLQNAIIIAWFCCIFLPLFPLLRKLKRNLFPFFEFEFGVNSIAYERAKNIRNTIGIGIILAFVVGIAVNIVSNFLI